MQFTVATLALLSSVASAAPTARSAGTSPTFNLKIKIAGHVAEGLSYLTSGDWWVQNKLGKMSLSSSESDASLLYNFGVKSRVATASVGVTITPGGTATVPSINVIEFVNNNGTDGVYVVYNERSDPTLYFDGGRFEACPGDDGDLFLNYVSPGQRYLNDCAAVDLVAICSTEGTGEPLKGQLGQMRDVPCVQE